MRSLQLWFSLFLAFLLISGCHQRSDKGKNINERGLVSDGDSKDPLDRITPRDKKLVHETYVYGQDEFSTGSKAALRVAVKGAKSLSQSLALSGAKVKVTLRKDEKSYSLFEGKTDKTGQVEAGLKIPPLPPGQYTMEILTSSDHGREKVERNIKLVRREKILLVTDKPMYQPGQVIRLRALALRPINLKPVAGEKILFEVEDSKGNKVFKKKVKSSEYGIGHSDFQLATEVNEGRYRIRAILGKNKTEKTVTVKKYVLPKFKISVDTEKNYFLPGQKVKGKIQADYIFGKPVAGGKVLIEASTFDVKFKKFYKVEGKTNQEGTFSFEFKVPDYLVGQPLEQGKALVKVEAKVVDKADHTQKKTSTYPVAARPLQIAAVPENGKLVPGVENRIYVVASYPDGRPAQCEVKVEGKVGGEKKDFEGKTDDSGIATITFTPSLKDFSQPKRRRRFRRPRKAKKRFSLQVSVKNDQGLSASKKITLAGDSSKENLLLRPSQAIYASGETMNFDILSTFEKGTIYFDIIKDRQTVLTKMTEVKKGRASISLDASADLFGTLECHAYKLRKDGRFIRSTRMVYVQPASQIEIGIKTDKKVYRPGEKAKLTFTTKNSKGQPLPAALGLTIVDEAVYALQEIQPGLEKVYFTIEKELSKAKYQIKNGPGASMTGLIQRREKLEKSRQKVAKILFSKVEALTSYSWKRNPQLERKKEFEKNLRAIYQGIYRFVYKGGSLGEKKDGQWGFRSDLLDKLVKEKILKENQITGPFGSKLTMTDLEKLTSFFSYQVMGSLETSFKIRKIYQATYKLWRKSKKRRELLKNLTLDQLVQEGNLKEALMRDAWDEKFRLQYNKKRSQYYYYWQLRRLEVTSAGADGKFDTKDDISAPHPYQVLAQLKKSGALELNRNELLGIIPPGGRLDMVQRELRDARPTRARFRDGNALGGNLKGAPMEKSTGKPTTADGADKSDKAGKSAPRIREYFPETLLFKPQLITDKLGKASFELKMADSITTWRLTASANSKTGRLGGKTSSLRVFQDFFVDIDFPVALTQGDEVEVPVAIYNYLDKSQTVKLVVKKEKDDWFELLDKAEKKVTMASKEVGVVYFRLKAKDIGTKKLTVMAYGSELSDAVRREVDVEPNGKKVEKVINGQLTKTVEHEVVIPQNAIPDASKILVKCYPGVGAVLVEGVSGLIRLPGG